MSSSVSAALEPHVGSAVYPVLFSPIEIGGVRLRNRIAHASIMTRFVRDGRPTETLAHYLGSRARGGTALIVTEPLGMIATQLRGDRVRVWSDADDEHLKRLADAVERWDSRILGQVQDPGRGRHAHGRNDHALGASALPDDLSWTVPHALSASRIRAMIAEWAAASRRLQRAGFSGIEISAGHGHLFHQFLSARSNRRDDEYGGDIAGRTRLLRELMAAIRAACGRPFVIGVKLPGPDGVAGSIDLDEAARIAAAVAATGEVDYWTFVWGAHASSLHEHLPGPAGPRAPYLERIRTLRAASAAVPTGAIAYITDPNEGERAVTDGTADLVFMGRSLITDPAFPEKARTGREADIRYCVSCNTCWRSIVEGNRLECDNNPLVGHPQEVDWRPEPAASPQRVVIVGSGIAGMEAAWVAASRGHRVELIGASAEPGGKTRLFAELPGGEHLSSIYDYQRLAGARYNVHYRFDTQGDLETILASKPDVVLLATGATMGVPDFVPPEFAESGDLPDLRSLMIALRGRKDRTEGRIVIYDCDHTDMTYAAAQRLTELFDGVVIVTPRERIASDVPLVNRQAIYQRLYERGVEIHTCVELRTIDGLEDAQLTAVNVYNGAATVLDGIVAVTYATARRPNDGLRSDLEKAGVKAIPIGDCYAPRTILAATREGFEVGSTL